MSDQPRSPEDMLSPSRFQRMDEVCDRFEDAWRAGQRPKIEDYLGDAPQPERPFFFRELLRVEVAYRRQIYETFSPDDYRQRFPDQVEFIKVVFDEGHQESKDSASVEHSRAAAEEPEMPARLGAYRILGVLGRGGFGTVYQGFDEELRRVVAIKVPHRHRVARDQDVKAYLAEARILANLDHPHIVPVYHAEHTDDGLCYVVFKFIEGSDLAKKIRAGRPSFVESAALIATVAETLHYAHRKGLVHRDVKPGNILLDSAGHAFVTDFGLALKEEDFGKGAAFAGTPAYMSPEQARGEGHRVDGRTDVVSLGAVCAALLTGKRPFRDDGLSGLLEQIARAEPRPPRQWDDAIPKELERVCLKALCKRARDRYPTAKDLADDLRCFLQQASAQEKLLLAGKASSPLVSTAATPVSSDTFEPEPHQVGNRPKGLGFVDSEQQPLILVPKGLRAFDEHDADFFLRLVPDARDRDGMPDSVRFWKNRIEPLDPDKTFSVGLVYGPSGCGKSSLVKAGLLPRLANHVLALYVEATARETEARLLKKLQKKCPALPEDRGLSETLAALRRGNGVAEGKKVLIVLDQFEQWLHAKRAEQDTELVQALRQCDGGRVQCIVLVRDDFWMGATRFMRELEVQLLEGHNSAAVDLFDLDHATKVLAAFGRAFGKLRQSGEISKEQKEFLKQAVSGLAQEDKVICVRLALFAEMMKGKPWTPASLKEVGGTEGVGVTFLDGTFSATTAPPKHRYHQQAARAVLRALLPDAGTNIKGSMRSSAELLQASGYAKRPEDFDELICLLDSEIRLITPIDPEGNTGEEASTVHVQMGERYYQLTHDYLVPALRDWLTRKQKETRQGRAQLRLAERAAHWNAQPVSRHLPAWWEWANIRLFTRPREWTAAQKNMMCKADRYHGLRSIVLTLLLVLAGWGSYEGYSRLQAHSLRDQLLVANTADVLPIVDNMTPFRRWINPLLRTAYRDAVNNHDARTQLHASLALLPVDPSQVNYLYGRLLNAEFTELQVIRDALMGYRKDVVERLWNALGNAQDTPERRFRAACVLASYDPDGETKDQAWPKACPFVTDQLLAAVQKSPSSYTLLLEMVRPVRQRLFGPLADVYHDRQRPESDRTFATNILADYAGDQPRLLADLLLDTDEKQFAVLYPKFKAQAEPDLRFLSDEIDRQLQPQWTDAPLDASWKQPDPALVQKIQAAHGLLEERFAFCQDMPLEQFRGVAQGLQLCGYRPSRFRPYSAGGHRLLVAALWTRDGLEYQLAQGLSAAAIAERDAALREQSFHPIDVTSSRSEDILLYAALWLKVPAQTRKTELAIGLDAKAAEAKDKELHKAGYWRDTTSVLFNADGQPSYTILWSKPADRKQSLGIDSTDTAFVGREAEYSAENSLSDTQVDVQLSQTAPPLKERQYAAIWHPVAGFTSKKVHGLDPRQHLEECKKLLTQRYRPISLAVAQFQPDQPLVTASVWHRPVVPDDAKEKLAKRQATAAVVLLKMNKPDKVWPLLQHHPDPRVRSYLIHRLRTLEAPVLAILKRLEETREVSERRALLLGVGQLGEQAIPPNERDRLIPRLLELYQHDSDPGIHGALAWLLQQWHQKDKLLAIDKDLARGGGTLAGARQWYVNGQEQTFVIVAGPVEFVMGSPRTEVGRQGGPANRVERLHRRHIPRTFALASHEVTIQQFLRFRKNHDYYSLYAPTEDCPVHRVSWYDAAAYCNWLSQEEGIPPEQWCYEPNAQGKYADGMRIKPNSLQLTGYRLPTEAEWEYACRAGATTSRFFGETAGLLEHYAWYTKNSQDRRQLPVGSLKPNDLGLFDMLGNALEWCQDRIREFPMAVAGQPVEDQGQALVLSDLEKQVLRGATFNYRANSCRCAYRVSSVPQTLDYAVGFRPARTLRVDQVSVRHADPH